MDPRATTCSARACSARASAAVSRRSPEPPRRRPRRSASRAWVRGAAASRSPRGRGRPSRTRWPSREAGSVGVPAGFTYLGQFIDHDLTFDKTNVMLGEHVAPAALLQARSPSLDLDSLYGAGPGDPGSEKFYEADGLHLKMGKTAAGDGLAVEGRLRPAARRGLDRCGEAEGDHPRPAERREPRRRADPPGDDPLPQPRRRHARQRSRRPALRSARGSG